MLFEAGRDRSEEFDLVEEPFDKFALAIKERAEATGPLGTPEQREAAARAAERRRRRYPLPDDPLPPLDRVVMTTAGAVIFTEITGELADSDTAARFYPEISQACLSLVWETWRKPTLKELVKAWPARRQPDLRDRACGWWQLSIDELRAKRRAAASRERALQKARAAATASLREPIGPSSPLGGHPPGARGAKNRVSRSALGLSIRPPSVIHNYRH
jgi:hypothetical protein